jgi:acyl-CoA reductase-like NAD-dependent aldehyde dehydrogenase
MSDFSLLIGGRLVPGAATIPVINPATEDVLADAPRANLAQLNDAVDAAKASFAVWSARPLRERGELLLALADAFAARQNEFARLLTEEQGKPLTHAAVEISQSIDVIRYFASLDLPLKVIKEDEKQKIFRQNIPLGVVAAITPWNFPVILLMIKLAPALLAGNTVVIKPAPTTPLTTLPLWRTLRGSTAARRRQCHCRSERSW